jgi:peptidoglycan/LPS O-acetylase OafA/YrhL
MTKLAKSSDEVKHVRIPTLDGWRAVAIIGVICCHLEPLFPYSIGKAMLLGGWGVQLFFALSGFLITSRLLDEYDQTGGIRWGDFYIRRAFRILPPAFFYLAVVAVLGLGLHLIPLQPRSIFSVIFFYRNYLSGEDWYTGHFWSLAVEEHFYLMWPAILCIVGIARGRRTAVTLVFLAILWHVADSHFDWIGHFWPLLRTETHRTDYNLDVLFLSAALAFLWRSERARATLQKFVRGYWALGIFALQLLFLATKTSFQYTGVELLMAPLPLVTVADPRGWLSRILETRLLGWIGRLSYSLYLWQQLTLRLTFLPKVFQRLPLNCVLAFLTAAFSYYLIERRFIQMGARLIRRRSSKRESLEQAKVASAGIPG